MGKPLGYGGGGARPCSAHTGAPTAVFPALCGRGGGRAGLPFGLEID